MKEYKYHRARGSNGEVLTPQSVSYLMLLGTIE
jgi:hypothetical protein